VKDMVWCELRFFVPWAAAAYVLKLCVCYLTVADVHGRVCIHTPVARANGIAVHHAYGSVFSLPLLGADQVFLFSSSSLPALLRFCVRVCLLPLCSR
jgi:hypothetical protein